MDGTNLCNDPQKKEYFHNNKVKLFKISNPECTVKKQKRDLLSKILGHVQTQCQKNTDHAFNKTVNGFKGMGLSMEGTALYSHFCLSETDVRWCMLLQKILQVQNL